MTTSISRRTAFKIGAGAAAAPFVASEGFAQAYPARPVTCVVPFGAGGSTDVIGRIVCDRLSQKLGQSFVIENKAGAGGNVGVAAVARSPADGYTIGMTTIANHGINPNLYGDRLPFKPLDDFEFLSLSSSQPNFMCVHPSVPAQTLAEFIAYLKANPGKENFGSSGIGTSIHLSGELFMQLTGTRMTHVPFRSSAGLVQGLITGEVKLSFDNFTSPYPHYKSGAIRGFAVTSLKRAAIAPEIPALADTLPGFDITSWNGFVAPKGTPKEICERLSKALQEVLAEAPLIKRFEEMGAESTPSTPDGMRQKSVAEMAKFKQIIDTAQIKLQN